MITVKTNIKVVGGNLLRKLAVARDPRPLLRPVAISVLAMITERIHEKGQAADGGPIGTYSKGYMAIRSGVFKNSDRYKKGMKTGQVKNAGIFTARSKTGAGSPRPNYRRGTDTKVIVSLTRQLENDWAVKATPKGWGIGFNNPHNAQKMEWVEKIKEKKIARLTTQEKDFALNKLKSLLTKELN